MCIRDRRSWSTTGSTCSAAPAAARSCTGTPGRRRRGSCSRALDLVEDAGADEKLAHGRAHDAFLPGALASDELEQLRARDHHEIVLLGQMPRAALEGLAQQTLDAVADDGSAQFLRDRQPQPRPLGARLSRAHERVQHEEPGGRRAPLPVDTLEVGSCLLYTSPSPR